jgi:hypothetical protein
MGRKALASSWWLAGWMDGWIFALHEYVRNMFLLEPRLGWRLDLLYLNLATGMSGPLAFFEPLIPQAQWMALWNNASYVLVL